jgi:NhaP-type Na+/H+ or K+/H+ antiporter
MVTGGYALADRFHISGPMAVVVAGLLIGNHGRFYEMSETTREHLDTFWELIVSVTYVVALASILSAHRLVSSEKRMDPPGIDKRMTGEPNYCD